MDDLRQDPRYARLPKWAQEGIGVLYRDREKLREEIQSWTGLNSTNIIINPDIGFARVGAKPRFLQPRTTVRYVVNGGSVDVNLRDRGNVGTVLELMGRDFSDNMMVVMANASNLFQVGFAGRARPAK